MIHIERNLEPGRAAEVFGVPTAIEEWNTRLGVESAVAEDIAGKLCTIATPDVHLGYDGWATRKVSEPFNYPSADGQPVEARLGLLVQAVYTNNHMQHRDGLKTVELLIQDEASPSTFVIAGAINYYEVSSSLGYWHAGHTPEIDLEAVMSGVMAANDQLGAVEQSADRKHVQSVEGKSNDRWIPTKQFYEQEPRAALLRSICLDAINASEASLRAEGGNRTTLNRLLRTGDELVYQGISPSMHEDSSQPTEGLYPLKFRSPIVLSEWLSGQIVQALADGVPNTRGKFMRWEDFKEVPNRERSLRTFMVAISLIPGLKEVAAYDEGPTRKLPHKEALSRILGLIDSR